MLPTNKLPSELPVPIITSKYFMFRGTMEQQAVQMTLAKSKVGVAFSDRFHYHGCVVFSVHAFDVGDIVTKLKAIDIQEVEIGTATWNDFFSIRKEVLIKIRPEFEVLADEYETISSILLYSAMCPNLTKVEPDAEMSEEDKKAWEWNCSPGRPLNQVRYYLKQLFRIDEDGCFFHVGKKYRIIIL